MFSDATLPGQVFFTLEKGCRVGPSELCVELCIGAMCWDFH